MRLGAVAAPMKIEMISSIICDSQEEIDRVVGDGKIDLEHLQSLNYVEAILRESIRLCASKTAGSRLTWLKTAIMGWL
jgi:hypothetical protein